MAGSAKNGTAVWAHRRPGVGYGSGMITVGDLLAEPDLRLKVVAGSAGTEASVRLVHVSELADPTPWLQGGELLLTTGHPLRRGTTAQRAYVRRLVAGGLAGLGGGVGFWYRRSPAAGLDEAEKASFPVFEVPYDVPFIAILEAWSAQNLAEQTRLLRRSMSLLQTLIGFVHEGRGLQAMVAAIASRTGGWVVLCRPAGPVLAAAGALPAPAEEVAAAYVDAADAGAGGHFAGDADGPHGPVAWQVVDVAGHTEAVVLLGGGRRRGEYEALVAAHGTTILGLELAKQAAVADTEQRLADDVVRLALGGAPDAEVDSRLAGFGIRLDAGATVLVVSDLPVRHARLLTGPPLARTVALTAGVANAGGSGGSDTVVGVQAVGVTARAIADDVAESTGRRVGLGTTGTLRQRVAEARYALGALPERPVADLEDVGTYRLLLGLAEPGALARFASGVLGPLMEHDAAHRADLVTSLQTFLAHNGHWEPAARALCVHRHTLRYRMRQVEELTGRDLSAADDRTELHLALKAHEMSRADR